MCGIVGAVTNHDVVPTLLEGLKRLEYRGYDSAGIAVLDAEQHLLCERAVGKVRVLAERLDSMPFAGTVGIAHTRWATHGSAVEMNAHPHLSGGTVAVVHNGIIENYAALRAALIAEGYVFSSETDTEVIVHLLHSALPKHDSLLAAVLAVRTQLEGAFALAVIHQETPDVLVAVRQGCPLVLGFADEGHYLASDPMALLSVTQKFSYLEEGDIALISRTDIQLFDVSGVPVQRPIQISKLSAETVGKGGYRHYMAKEMFEQPDALAATLEGRLTSSGVPAEILGPNAAELLPKISRVCIVACGSAYHAGLVGRYWIEQLTGLLCTVEIASEFRYRGSVIESDTLFVAISQSGETADTLAALRWVKSQKVLATLAICNSPESALVRESDWVLLTRAGIEIGVASTKAFTTQLVGLLLLALTLARYRNIAHEQLIIWQQALMQVPRAVEMALSLDADLKILAEKFVGARDALFVARNTLYPIALEGALKLTEISYIHAGGYPAGELKHGPLALVDKSMPIIALAPNDTLSEKLQSNLHEVQARGGLLFICADASTIESKRIPGAMYISMPSIPTLIAPIVYSIPVQLLAYHVAVCRGTDIDQPRNLAKSVTVE